MSKEKTKQLHKQVAPYAKSDTWHSIGQIINTIPPFFFLWFLAYQSYLVHPLLSLPFAVIAAGFMVRTFIIFHDATHGSFFKKKWANDLIGNITGILTFFPYEQWKREHITHHATSSNLDKRGTGDIWVMTVEEYVNASKWERFIYRFYRNPLVMFGIGPFYLVFFSNRLNRKGARLKERLNTHFTSLMIALISIGMMLWIGWQPFVVIQGTIIFVAASLGIWLFYIQHTFEDSYFEHKEDWNYVQAAVEGSSYYKLPKVLQWLTGNIGFHHVHHLAPRVPNYRLEEAHENVKPLQEATTLTLKTSLETIKYKLYDAEEQRFVTFRDVAPLIADEKRRVTS